MNTYEVKPGQEGTWAALQVAVVSLCSWLFIGTFDMPTETAVPVAAACGALSRPVLGYVIAWLPKRKREAEPTP